MKECLACNKKLRFLGENSGLDIFRCPSCGFGITSGIFSKTQYSAYHRDKVYVKEKEQFKNIFDKRVGIILKSKKGGKALEVGSSTGVFLSLLKERGWEVQGVEPSATSAQAASKMGIPTINTTFESAEIPKNSFDVIIFSHVLEHMEDPHTVLNKANQILKNGGIILIDVPNFASLTARLAGAGWKYILPKEHRWHFTPQSLSLLLNEAGFRVVYWETHSGIWDYGNPLKEIWQALTGRKKRFFTDVLTAIPASIITKLRLGTGLTLIAKKVTD